MFYVFLNRVENILLESIIQLRKHKVPGSSVVKRTRLHAPVVTSKIKNPFSLEFRDDTLTFLYSCLSHRLCMRVYPLAGVSLQVVRSCFHRSRFIAERRQSSVSRKFNICVGEISARRFAGWLDEDYARSSH